MCLPVLRSILKIVDMKGLLIIVLHLLQSGTGNPELNLNLTDWLAILYKVVVIRSPNKKVARLLQTVNITVVLRNSKYQLSNSA